MAIIISVGHPTKPWKAKIKIDALDLEAVYDRHLSECHTHEEVEAVKRRWQVIFACAGEDGESLANLRQMEITMKEDEG